MHKNMTAPPSSQIFYDDRGSDRVLRVTWHPEHRMAVFSVWHRDTCVTTYRMPAREVPTFVQGLTSGLLELNPATANIDHRPRARTSLDEQPKHPTWDEALRDAAEDSTVRAMTDAERGQQPAREATLRDTAQDSAVRGLSAVIEGCTRLRDRLRRN